MGGYGIINSNSYFLKKNLSIIKVGGQVEFFKPPKPDSACFYIYIYSIQSLVSLYLISNLNFIFY